MKPRYSTVLPVLAVLPVFGAAMYARAADSPSKNSKPISRPKSIHSNHTPAHFGFTPAGSANIGAQRTLLVRVRPDRDVPGRIARMVSTLGRVESWRPSQHAYRVTLRDGMVVATALKQLAHHPDIEWVRPTAVPGGLAVDLTYLPDVERYYKRLLKMAHDRHEAEHEKEEAAHHEGAKAGEANAVAQKEEDDEDGLDWIRAYEFWFKMRQHNGRIDWTKYDLAAANRDAMPPGPASRFGVAPRGSGGGGSGPKFNSIVPPPAPGGWQYLGPKNYYAGYDPGPNTGRINGTAYDPQNPSTIYVASAGGGVWVSKDSGSTFAPLSDTWKYLNTTCVAVDPTNSNIVYVGTGDADGFSGFGNGIMKSTNATTLATFTNVGLGGSVISSLTIDPDNPHIILASTIGGIARSTDSGANWAPVKIAGTATNLPFDYYRDVSFGVPDEFGNRFVYASAFDVQGAMWRSSDNGATWTFFPLVDTQGNPTQDPNYPFIENIRLATSPSNKDAVYVQFSLLNTSAARKQYTLKSIDAGFSWVDITNELQNANWTQSGYDNYLAIGKVWDDQFVFTDVSYSGLIDINFSPTEGYVWQSVGKVYTPGAQIHPDQHAMSFNPVQDDPFFLEALAGCDGGVYGITYDALSGTSTFTSLGLNVFVTQFYHIALNPLDPNYVMGGLQDNGTPNSLGDLQNWTSVSGGDGGWCSINLRFPSFQTSSSQSSGVRNATVLPITRTTDGWTTRRDISLTASGDYAQFIPPHIVDPNNPSIIYAASSYLYKWNDAITTGSKWSRRLGSSIPPPMGSVPGTKLAGGAFDADADPAAVVCISIAPSDSTRLYTGADDGSLWMTTDGGAAFARINTGTPGTLPFVAYPYPPFGFPANAISSISIHPTNPNDIIVASSAGIYRCLNTRAIPRNWVNITGPLAVSANAIARDPFDPSNTIYAGTDVGVFMTVNGGSTWTNITNPYGLPNAQVNDLQTMTYPNLGVAYLYAGTYGRGMWRILLVPPTALTGLSVAPNPVWEGQTSTGTVQLNTIATSPTVVNLASTDTTTATVPSSVTVPVGANSATFTISTKSINPDKTVTIAASYNSVVKTAQLTVRSSVPTAVGVSPSSGCIGAPIVGSVILTTAPAAPAVISLTSSDTTAVTVPATITVPVPLNLQTAPHPYSFPFPVTVVNDSIAKTVTLTATWRGISKSVQFNVITRSMGAITINPATLKGGQSAQGAAFLTCAAAGTSQVVTLTSSNPAVASVPASVTITSGNISASFTIATTPVVDQTIVTITGTYKGVSKSATITVLPPIVATSTSFMPNPVCANSFTQGTIRLDTPAPFGGLTVTFTTDKPAVVAPPTSVIIPQGFTYKTFSVTTKNVTVDTTANITAIIHGVSSTSSLTVKAPVPRYATIYPSYAKGGKPITVTPNITCPAPVGGAVVSITSDDPIVIPPATVVIPAGTTTGNFTLQTTSPFFAEYVTLTITYNGVSTTAYVYVFP